MTTGKKQDALDAIRWPLKAIKQEEARLHGYVNVARKEGASWTEVGKVLGISRQAAQQRFGTTQDKINDVIRTTKPKELATDDLDLNDIDSELYWGGAD